MTTTAQLMHHSLSTGRSKTHRKRKTKQYLRTDRQLLARNQMLTNRNQMQMQLRRNRPTNNKIRTNTNRQQSATAYPQNAAHQSICLIENSPSANRNTRPTHNCPLTTTNQLIPPPTINQKTYRTITIHQHLPIQSCSQKAAHHQPPSNVSPPMPIENCPTTTAHPQWPNHK